MINFDLVVQISVTSTDNSPSQDYTHHTHPGNQNTLSHVTPGFKPLTEKKCGLIVQSLLQILLQTDRPCLMFSVVFQRLTINISHIFLEA